VRRREFVVLVSSTVAWPIRVRAQQQTGMVHRIGYLSSGSANPRLANPGPLEAFRKGLRDLGWIEGQNIIIEYRFAEGQFDRLPSLADELVRLKVDVIAASPGPAALAAKNATGTIPIVMMAVADPIRLGLAESLARPGGNVTGLSYSVGMDTLEKNLELLKEAAPNARRVAVLSNPDNPNHALAISIVNTAARAVGVQLQLMDARGPDEFEGAFAAMATERVGALLVVGDPVLTMNRAQLADLAVQNRLPSMHTLREYVEAGGLMSYGPSLSDLLRRGASYVNKILKGAKPADLPVEQPTKFELIINLRTAKALGLTVPPSLLLRADEVIE
jgi:putative ABC transport system substrate-binding protein